MDGSTSKVQIEPYSVGDKVMRNYANAVELAKILGTKRGTVYHWVKCCGMPVLRVKGYREHYLFCVEECQAWHTAYYSRADFNKPKPYRPSPRTIETWITSILPCTVESWEARGLTPEHRKGPGSQNYYLV